MSSAITRRSRSDSGTSPATIRCARPSTIAVLPTPGSPISTGLFLVRRDSTWITRRISSSRPITGSSLPALGVAVRSRPNFSSACIVSSGFGEVTRCGPRTSAIAFRSDVAVGRAGRPPPGLVGEREQQVLDRDELVAERRHLLLGALEHADEALRRADLGLLAAHRSAAACRCASGCARRSPRRRRRACAARGGEPVLLVEQGGEQVRRGDLGLRLSPASRCAAATASWDLIVKRSACTWLASRS